MKLPRTYMKAYRMAQAVYGRRESDCNRMSAAQAAYWWLNDNHGGMWSPEYAELCWLGRYYTPGASECGPNDEVTTMIYEELS
jgi:hypothetical protein